MMQVPGAREVGVEFFTLSKSYNMPGWRVGFAVGNREMIAALGAAQIVLRLRDVRAGAGRGDRRAQRTAGVRRRDRETYRSRRDVLVDGLNRAGWPVEKPKATMFVWAPIPEPFREMGSLEFAKFLLAEAKVAVSPGSRLRRGR